MVEKRTHPMTPEELAELDIYLRAARDKSLETGRLNRPDAEAAVNNVYRTAGFSEPRQILWMDSPLGGLIAVTVLQEMEEILKNHRTVKFPFS